MKLLDIVALKEDLPDRNLLASQVGTIVEFLASEVYEVEFSDDDGQTYAMLPLHSSQLLQLNWLTVNCRHPSILNNIDYLAATHPTNSLSANKYNTHHCCKMRRELV
jgi:Domain of unknown function (DUF4926)